MATATRAVETMVEEHSRFGERLRGRLAPDKANGRDAPAILLGQSSEKFRCVPRR